MKGALFAAVLALATLVAGGFAWHTHHALGETRRELAGTKTQLDKAKADLKALQDEAAALRKDAAAQKIALEQMQTELNSAQHFLEVERLASARLREDFARAMTARGAPGGRPASAQSLPPGLILPMPVQSATPPPARIAPGNRGVSIGVGVPAR